MAKRLASKGAPEQGASLPAKFDADQHYRVIVATKFQVGRMTFRPGVATLRGDIAEQFRNNLIAIMK